MNIEPNTLAWQDAYKLLIGSVLPRPIAFVSTVSRAGEANLAPFSFFTGICADPMLVCFAPMVRGSDGGKKDTLRNIEDTQEFVINIVGEKLAQQMNDTAIEYGSDVDEFETVGLTKEPSQKIQVPRVKESDVHLECVVERILHFGEHAGAGSLVIGKVVLVHVRDELYKDGKIITELLQPIGRLAGQMYTKALADTFVLERKTIPQKAGETL
ncbi:flavin reductase family protein [Ectobacillus antri]|jgi:flavin reductase (DIM6/NTAB) family NADH-FMN oxidoreductase RutF|uniref:Flavin reductase family protein n=1 Tax=Ectobacillus antri TaxID=2486280 RepID=A0ABT6H6L5_9BACI|nr:flavin reductase family protein [Ectobacillus antri]MDG4657921.1 flavin reductase family protein [Ectobacillus antri]MDG5754995.1 flavin reductase family protein [Ectobacillus antri]